MRSGRVSPALVCAAYLLMAVGLAGVGGRLSAETEVRPLLSRGAAPALDLTGLAALVGSLAAALAAAAKAAEALQGLVLSDRDRGRPEATASPGCPPGGCPKREAG